MVGKQSTSLTEELIDAINMPGLRPIPAYISESDALSVEEFLQCEITQYHMGRQYK